MRKRFYGLIAAAVVALQFTFPIFTNDVHAASTSELATACGNLGGTFNVSNGSSNGLSWTCNGAKTAGTASSTDVGKYSTACTTLGGHFSVSSSNANGANWTCNGLKTAGTAPVNGGGGSGGGSGGSGGSGGGATSGSNPSNARAANTDCPPTAILTGVSGCGDGSAIFNVLSIVLNILTFGVGAAAAIGVVITGYQYMTARDNPSAVAKAKNRLLQIVIGLAIWAVFWGVLQFVLPGGIFGDGSTS